MIDREIKKMTNKLVKEIREDGLYENFGAREVRELIVKYVDPTDFSKEMDRIRDKIAIFAEWCSNVTLAEFEGR